MKPSCENIDSFIVETIQPPKGVPFNKKPPSLKIIVLSPGLSSDLTFVNANILTNQSAIGHVNQWVQKAATLGCDGIKLAGLIGYKTAVTVIAEINRLAPDLCFSITSKGMAGGQASLPSVNPSASSLSCLVNWVAPFDPIPLFSKRLKAFAKSGIWNHVVLPSPKGGADGTNVIRFALANPNLVHSWSVFDNAQYTLEKLFEKMDLLYSRYFSYPLLPGRPIWHYLNSDDHLMAYLSHYDRQQLGRWWIPSGPYDSQQSPIELGSRLGYHYVQPDKLTKDQLDEICQLVAAGGSVNTRWVRHNLKRAFLIAFVTEMGRIVGNSSLKHPRPEYIDTLNRQAGMDLSGYLERGYTSVRPEYRGMGLGTRLLKGLTSRADGKPIFSLIAEDNTATQKIATRNNTRKVATFFSRKAKKEMGVWMPANR